MPTRAKSVSKRKPTLTKAKRKAWEAFSKYIRTRDAIETTRTLEYAVCVTCPRQYHIKSMDAGHWISRGHLAVLFDETNVHAQCVYCNKGLDGNAEAYRRFIEDKYGADVVEDLYIRSKQSVKYTIQDYEEIETIYKNKLKRLVENF